MPGYRANQPGDAAGYANEVFDPESVYDNQAFPREPTWANFFGTEQYANFREFFAKNIPIRSSTQQGASRGSSISLPPRSYKDDSTIDETREGAKCTRLSISAMIVIITCAVLLCATVVTIVTVYFTSNGAQDVSTEAPTTAAPLEDRVSADITLSVSNFNYTPAMSDPTSDDFQSVAGPFCDGIDRAYLSGNQSETYRGCEVTSLESGSVRVNFQLIFVAITVQVTQEDIKISLLQVFAPTVTNETSIGAFVVVLTTIQVETPVIQTNVRLTGKNECASNNGGCAQKCNDLDVSFKCTCEKGYVLGSDGRSCTDIDECATNNGGCGSTCTNSDGSYVCGCESGYTLNSDRFACDDEDECATNNGGCATSCDNSPGTFACSCASGFSLNADGLACDGKGYDGNRLR